MFLCLLLGLSCSQGLWMFLDRSSFHMVHTLLQRLSNLLTLAQWARRQQGSAHIWHGTLEQHVDISPCSCPNQFTCKFHIFIIFLIHFFSYGGPMYGLQGFIQILRKRTWLLEPRARGTKATHLAGAAGPVVGHHGSSAQVPWYG